MLYLLLCFLQYEILLCFGLYLLFFIVFVLSSLCKVYASYLRFLMPPRIFNIVSPGYFIVLGEHYDTPPCVHCPLLLEVFMTTCDSCPFFNCIVLFRQYQRYSGYCRLFRIGHFYRLVPWDHKVCFLYPFIRHHEKHLI